MALSPYAPDSRPVLVADAMITAVNRYPQKDVQLLPILDTLALLIQRPLCFSFFRKKASDTYECLRTTLCDPDLDEQFQQTLLSVEKTGSNLIAVPGTEVFLAVHEIKPERVDGVLKAKFPELADTQPFKALFDVLDGEESGLGKDVLRHIAQSLNDSKQMPTVRFGGSEDDSYWDDRRRILRRITPRSLTDLVKPVVNGALALVSDSPLIKTLPGKQLPFSNLFFVLRSATNDSIRRLCFSYTAQVLLSSDQKCAISAAVDAAYPSLIELPLGTDARAIADSVFHSGTVDFSDEEAGKGRDVPSGNKESSDWKRQEAESKVYAAITKNPHVFYVPVHVSGVPWFALFTISRRNEETGTWAHNYAIYRSLISGVAENIRALAKSTYLQLVKEIFLEEYRKQDQPSFMRRVNDRWEELSLVFPFPSIRLASQSPRSNDRRVKLPDGLLAEVEIRPNRWFPTQIKYDVLDEMSVHQTLADALTEVEKEGRAARLEWESQEHTIFNVLPTNQIEAALACEPSELKGEARGFIEDARRKTMVLETSLSIPLANRPLGRLQAITGVSGLLTWLKVNGSFGRKTCVLTLPSDVPDFPLNGRPELANAFTLFWNLWSNAAKTHGKHSSATYWITGVRQNGSLIVTFKNAGELSPSYVHYLLQDGATWPGPPERKGLIIVKDKLKVLNWKLSDILVEGGFTTIFIALSPPNNPVQLDIGGKS